MKKAKVVLCGVMLCLLAESSFAADPVQRPEAKSNVPSMAMANYRGTYGIRLEGSHLIPYANQVGVDSYTFNTHGERYYDVKAKVRTASGVQKEFTCSTGPGSFSTNHCSINSAGADSVSLQFNTIEFPGWADGQELLLTAHVMFPVGSGHSEYFSNTISVPFSREVGTPAVTSLSQNAFQTTSSNWSVRVSGRNLDRTAIVRIDDSGVAGSRLQANDDGTGVVDIVIPENSRRAGNHTISLCRIELAPPYPSQKLICSPPAAYTVAMTLEKMARPMSPALNNAIVAKVQPGVLGTVAQTAPVAVTVTCDRTPLYADKNGTVMMSKSGPAYARKGQGFHVSVATVTGAQNKSLRVVDMSPQAYIDASCVK